MTARFKKQVKLCKKRGLNLSILEKVIDILAEQGELPVSYKPHKLSGNYAGCWECHLKSDWLLVWKPIDNQMVLILTATGTHSDLF